MFQFRPNPPRAFPCDVNQKGLEAKLQVFTWSFPADWPSHTPLPDQASLPILHIKGLGSKELQEITKERKEVF